MIDADSKPFLVDAEIDFVTDQMGSQLTLKAPNAKVRKVNDNAPLKERVQYVIDAEINPQLANHGGQCFSGRTDRRWCGGVAIRWWL